jgi:hypothetical protein
VFTILTQGELVGLLLLTLFAWRAGSSAFKLLYSPSRERMARRIRRLFIRLGVLYVVIAAILVLAVWKKVLFPPVFWRDMLALRMPLVLTGAAAMAAMSIPRLITLRRIVRQADDESALLDARKDSAHPRLIMPFRLTALTGLTALYFALRPPVPFRAAEVFLPLALLAFAVMWLWQAHHRRFIIASVSEELVFHRWRHMLIRLAVLLGAAGIAWMFLFMAMVNSRLPDELDMMSGPMDFGRTAAAAEASAHVHAGNHADDASSPAVSVVDLTGDISGEPDRRFILTGAKRTLRLASGHEAEAWTWNGQIPGPELRVKEGELVEVTLVNRDIEQGVAAHWHGLDVPNAMDGVPGVTQDVVLPGETFTYRFRAKQTGTYWYH